MSGIRETGEVIGDFIKNHPSSAFFDAGNCHQTIDPLLIIGQHNLEQSVKLFTCLPSLSKYFLIANQEGTEKINGHPISARNVPAQTDKRRKNPLSFSAEGEMVTGPCAGCRRENSRLLFQGMLYKFMPSLP